MKILKQYWFVILIITAVIAAVVIRTFSPWNFKYDAIRLAEPSMDGSNLLSPEMLSDPQRDYLIIRLQRYDENPADLPEPSVRIGPDSILVSRNLDRIRNHKGYVVLASTDESVSAKVWMILRQMGIRNLFILEPGNHSHSTKKAFRPDTIPEPEH